VYTLGTVSSYSNTANVDKTQTLIGPLLNTGVVTPTTTTSAHNLGGALQSTAWGNGAINSGAGTTFNNANTLECTSCHNPHGNGNYRILRPVPVGSGVTGAGVTITDDVSLHNYTTTNYWLVDDPYSATQTLNTSATSTNNSSTYLKNISAWCGTCHTRILDPGSSWGMSLAKAGPAAVTVTDSVITTKTAVTTDPYNKYGYVKVTAASLSTLVTGSQVVFTSATFSSTLYGLQPNLNEVAVLGASRADVDGTSTDFLLLTQAGGNISLAATSSAAAFFYGDIVTDANYAFRHRSDNGSLANGRIQWTGATTDPQKATYNASFESQNNPNCVTCHVAHGSNVSATGDANSQFSSAVPWPGGSTAAVNVHGGANSFLLRVSNRGMCKLCHNV
jgi:hypothetical protein